MLIYVLDEQGKGQSVAISKGNNLFGWINIRRSILLVSGVYAGTQVVKRVKAGGL